MVETSVMILCQSFDWNQANHLYSNISRFSVRTMNGREQELVTEMKNYWLEVLGVVK